VKPAENHDRKADWKTGLLERLHDPLQLRICVTGAVLLIGYLGVYMPLDNDFEETTRELKHEQKMVDLACSVEGLRVQYRRFRDRLPKGADSKEWVQYVLDGMRKFPLRLASMDCDVPRDMGPYKAVVLRIEVEGGFSALDGFLRWLESNPRLVRADSVRIAPSRSNLSVLVMQITVLGVMS
jgi:Tfp pilus assembly protein PilO